MARKIKRFFMFVFFSLFFTMLGRGQKVSVPSEKQDSVSAEKSILPITLSGNTAEAGWTCYG